MREQIIWEWVKWEWEDMGGGGNTYMGEDLWHRHLAPENSDHDVIDVNATLFPHIFGEEAIVEGRERALQRDSNDSGIIWISRYLESGYIGW